MLTRSRSLIKKSRTLVQWSVLVMTTYAGVMFYFFVDALERGVLPAIRRCPSIEGFLPIGALMSLKLWLTEGTVDPVHPAALVIFTGSIVLSVIVKKSFCSWICPVGTVSEFVTMTGRKVFGRDFFLPKYADYALRSVKYLLMSFFLFVILIKMSSSEIGAFLQTPYWKVTDIKLLKFFTNMSHATMVILFIIFMLSLFYGSFWCRYLCPYGGMLGLVSLLSPLKIYRDDSLCIRCGRCDARCPSRLAVSMKRVVRSPECTGCLTCVGCCPVEGAIDMSLAGKKRIRPLGVVALIVIVFFGAILAARLTGVWYSSVPTEELRSLVPFIGTLEHP